MEGTPETLPTELAVILVVGKFIPKTTEKDKRNETIAQFLIQKEMP